MNEIVKYLLQQIFKSNDNKEYLVDLLLNHWGFYQNETMFKTFSVHSITHNQSAMHHDLIYFYGQRKNILQKALIIYDIDYKLLPIPKPSWISKL